VLLDSTQQHPRFNIGDRVKKATGYAYPGVVVSVFFTRERKLRYVVEHLTSIGMLHIFNEEQLQDAQEPES
jgi:hypothetical protein